MFPEPYDITGRVFLSVFFVICFGYQRHPATLGQPKKKSQEKEITTVSFVEQRYSSADQIPPAHASFSFTFAIFFF